MSLHVGEPFGAAQVPQITIVIGGLGSVKRVRRAYVEWKRLDAEGSETCIIESDDDGICITGEARFLTAVGPAKFDYELRCDRNWAGRRARVAGRAGSTEINLGLEMADSAIWKWTGSSTGMLEGPLDIDLGFSPVTNTTAIRRLPLKTDERAELIAIWLDPEDWTFKPLQQTYRRLSRTTFGYSSSQGHYRAAIEVDDHGLVRAYGREWEASVIETV